MIMIEIYFLIFDYFYFHNDDPSSLVNYTNCLKICDQRDMTLPSANDDYLVLHQIKSLNIERYTASSSVTPKNGKQNFLSYFIGKLK